MTTTNRFSRSACVIGALGCSLSLSGCGGGGGGSGDGNGSAAGQTSTGGASPANASGYSWQPLGLGVFGQVQSAVIFNDELIIGGEFRSSGDTDLAGIGVWRDDAWQPLGDHFTMPFRSFLVHEGALYTGGHTEGREELYGLLRIDADGEVTRLGDPLQDGGIEALVEFEGDLYVAGGFHNIGTTLSGSIARWDGQQYHELTDLSPNNAVWDLAVYKGDLYVAGWFQFYDSWGEDARPINYIARWDGEKWHPVGSGLDDSAYTLTVCNDLLYIGGDFTMAGEVPARHIVAWDGSSWLPLGEGTDGPVRTMTAFDDGSGEALIVGGQFMTAGGVNALNIARWNGSAWSGLGAGLDDDVAVVYAITEGPLAPALFAGGDFYAAGDTPLSRIAIWRKE